MSPVRLPLAVLTAALLIAAPTARSQEPNPIPTHFTHIYASPDQAQQQVNQALQLAAQQHKRLLIDFGTDKCANCQVLNHYLNEHENHVQLAEHFLIVHVDVGQKKDQDRDLAARYGVDLSKGLPAVAVVDSSGKVLSDDAEFTRAANMAPTDVTSFLNKWRQ